MVIRHVRFQERSIEKNELRTYFSRLFHNLITGMRSKCYCFENVTMGWAKSNQAFHSDWREGGKVTRTCLPVQIAEYH